MNTSDDSWLLARVAQRDKDAMGALYRRHHDALFAFVRARGGDREMSADVVQDAMLEVWRTAARYRGTSSVRTWLFAIARNKYVDRVRGGARLSFVDDVPETPDTTPEAAAIIEAAQDADRVRRCVEALKPAQRVVVRMAFYDGLPYEEISEIEGLPAGTVKSRIFHAKQALLRCLGG